MASSDSTKSARDETECSANAPVAGRYRLSRKVGAGGMGSVWLAHDLLLDATCAIKLIDNDKAADEEIRTRFAREAKASAQLRSPHVVNVFDYGEWDGAHYIAMEYLVGEDLGTRLDRLGRLEPALAYRIVAHVARALMSAHALGIVHRDLKPENIFLVQSYDEEIAKVLDFGIAQNRAYSLDNRATREGTFLGTPCYMSPEQARGKPVDHRSDLWSLGVIAFQCLTGKLPFESDALGELMGMILYEPLPKLTNYNSDLPTGIDGWWEHAAARERDQRFDSAKQMADELGVLLGIESVVTVPTVPPKHISSFPPSNEKSGVITAPSVKQDDVRVATPEPRAAQWSLVQAVSATARTVDEEALPNSPRESHTQLSPNYLARWYGRFPVFRSNLKWFVVAIPAVIILLVLGIVLGVAMKSKTAGAVAPSAIPEGSATRERIPKSTQSHASPELVPDTLTVDMLPLVSPSAQTGKGPSDPGRNTDNGSRKQEPGSNRTPSNARSPKAVRDYGI